MSSIDPAQAARRQLDAYNARDLDAFLAAYADDVVVYAHPSGAVLMDGKAAMQERYGTLFREHPDLHARLLHRIVHASFAIDHEEVAGLKEGELVYAVATYEVGEDGLIHGVWFLGAR